MAYMDILNLLLRLGLSVLLAGVIGFEREKKGQFAGFRTHILVCLGAALVSITNIYISKEMGGDPARITAQIISGIGFLGAGAIIVNNDQQNVRGLTTAAGLWAVACIGIAVGYGLYIPAIIATLIILSTFTVFKKVDTLYKSTKMVNLYIEMSSAKGVRKIIELFSENNYRVYSIMPQNKWMGDQMCVFLTADIPLHDEDKFMTELHLIEYIEYIGIMN